MLKKIRGPDSRYLCSKHLNFAHEKRVIFDNSSFCSLFGFLCTVMLVNTFNLLSNSNGYSKMLPSLKAPLTVTSEEARYHNL